MNWKVYTNYQKTDQKWLGNIPEHWSTLRLKYCATHITKKLDGINSELNFVGLQHIESWTGRLVNNTGDTSSEGQVRHYQSGDVLFGKLRPYLAKVLCTINEGTCSGELLVLRPRLVVQKYLFYFLLMPELIAIVNSSTYGVKMPRASWEFIGNLRVTVPTENEQDAIAQFLNLKTFHIDTLIEKKQKQIELLQEKRSALISHVVTKGLDPNVPMKESGIEWVGKIPNHWDTNRITTLGSFSKGRGISKDEIKTSGIPCIHYGEIYTDYNRIVYNTKSFINEESSKKGEIAKKGDVLFTASGESITEIGKTILYYGDDDIFVGGDIIILKLKDTLNPKFISYVMNSNYINHQKSSMSKGEIVVHIYSQQLKEIKTALPTLEEQIKISDYLDVQTTKIDVLLFKVKDCIAKLEEYRIALISATVTGKIDVRESREV